LSKYVGESEGNLRELFKTAKENAPSVIFIDEVDGLGRARSEGHANSANHTILTTLLAEMNTIPTGEVLVLAATNCPQLCDTALVRKGRFDLTINLPLPNTAARGKILTHYFGKKSLSVERPILARMVKLTEKTTGSDLKNYVGNIHINLVERVFPDQSWRGMTERELRGKLSELKGIDMEADVLPVLKDIIEANDELAIVEEE